MSPDVRGLIEGWLAEALSGDRRDFAVFLDGELPGRPWDRAARLDAAAVEPDGIRLELRYENKPVTLSISGIERARLGAHPWSERALRLEGDIALCSASLEGRWFPRPKRREQRSGALWLVGG